jgi:hypothetical protein
VSDDTVMTAAQVGKVAVALPDVRVRALARSHERLRAMFEEAAVRIAKQSDALTRRAERAGPETEATAVGDDVDDGFGSLDDFDEAEPCDYCGGLGVVDDAADDGTEDFDVCPICGGADS